MMLRLLIAMLAAAAMESCLALDMSAYQHSDGAITVHSSGDNVDPYFAMKALWVSRQLDDPAPLESLSWIGWLMPRQKKDGSFARYCEKDGEWRECERSDADDSMLALWMELLYETAPRHRLPPGWLGSAERADRALRSLRNPASGLYRTGFDSKESLLMDNVEVYEALKRIGEILEQSGDRVRARRFLKQARDLKNAMISAFRADRNGILRWSTDDHGTGTFYPYAVADLYPWLHGMRTKGFGNMESWDEWLKQYGQIWLSRSGDSYPWGLVALLALRDHSYPYVDRWIANAAALRGGDNWDVLEEAVLQGLARKNLKLPDIARASSGQDVTKMRKAVR